MSNRSDIASVHNKRKCLINKNFKRLGYIFMIEARRRKLINKSKRKK